MRNNYIVTYDVSSKKRLQNVFKLMKGYGDHIQYSVFSCILSKKELLLMKIDLENIINNNEDQILIFNLGYYKGRAKTVLLKLIKKYSLSVEAKKAKRIINITLGLPYIRISPDHGVAENITGKKIANPGSLIESIKFFNYIN